MFQANMMKSVILLEMNDNRQHVGTVGHTDVTQYQHTYTHAHTNTHTYKHKYTHKSTCEGECIITCSNRQPTRSYADAHARHIYFCSLD